MNGDTPSVGMVDGVLPEIGRVGILRPVYVIAHVEVEWVVSCIEDK